MKWDTKLKYEVKTMRIQCKGDGHIMHHITNVDDGSEINIFVHSFDTGSNLNLSLTFQNFRFNEKFVPPA